MKLPWKLTKEARHPPKRAGEAVDRSPAFPTRRQWFAGAAGAALGGTALAADAALRPASSLAQTNIVVDLTSNQTIDGVKTFVKPPVVPADAFPQAAVDGLVDELAAKQTAISPGTYVGPGAAVEGASSSAVLGSLKIKGDDNERFQLLANGDLRWLDPATGSLINYLKLATTGHVETAGFKLRMDASPASAPELHFHASNASAPDHLAWVFGIDVAQAVDPTTNAAPARDIVIAKATASGAVIDGFYGKHRGGNLVPIWGLGNASYWETSTESYLLTVNPTSNEATMGGLLILMPTANTTPALTIRDGAGVNRVFIEGHDGSYYFRGNHLLTGAAVAIKAVTSVPLAFCNSAGAHFFSFAYDGAGIRFRSVSAGTTIWQAYPTALDVLQRFNAKGDAVIGAAGTGVSFYGGRPVEKQTGVPVTADGIHAALVALNLIAP
jgi:hypothetical protein